MWKKLALWIAQVLIKAATEKVVTEIQEKHDATATHHQREGPPTG